jgi:radical SAM superfamily enzyme YgiQ (UPF0313 family)
VRLLLVDNFVMPENLEPSLFDVHPHLGLLSLAAVAQREGHEVAIYDPKREVRFGRHAYDRNFYANAAEDILHHAPDAVGFTTLGCSFLFAVRVAEIIKNRRPFLPVLLGGPHATMLDRQILAAYGQFDIVVRHEAEETLPPLLAALDRRAFDAISGITWRAGKEIKSTPGMPKIDDLDQLPRLPYDLYPVRELGLDLMRVEAGRGCPFECTFCSTSSFFQRSYRLKSPQRLVSEMDFLHEQYGAEEFKLDHDLFTVDRRKVRAFCEAVQDRRYRWRVSARTDCVDEQLLEEMALAGCIGLYFGIETGSQRMQRIAQKRLKLSEIDGILDVAQSLGIESTTSFITGYPEEQREDHAATLDMLGKCFQRPQELCLPQLHILVPEPGTPMFSRHRQSLSYDAYATRFNARLLSDGDAAHIRDHPDLFSTYYYYPMQEMPRSSCTFAVEAVDTLRIVGHEILSYLLLFYQGRLSRLMASFQEWMAQNRPEEAMGPGLALAFISHSFGPDHHLTSLFRYGMQIGMLTRNLAPTTGAGGLDLHFDPQCAYTLGPKTVLFSDLHDCSQLLERIRRLAPDAAPMDDSETGDRGCYVVVLNGSSLTHYAIDPGVEGILTLFTVPRSIREVRTFLRQISSATPPRNSFFRQLVEIGALVPNAAMAPHSDRGC